MLVLFETAAGYALFKLLDDGKLAVVEELGRAFETPERANKMHAAARQQRRPRACRSRRPCAQCEAEGVQPV